MKNLFDKYYRRYDMWYDKNKFAYLSELEAIKKVLPKRGRGLEIGVGTGRFAQPLGIGTGIDPSKNMIRIARERGVQVVLGLGEDLPFKDGAFDYVAVIVTICFLKDPLKVVKEAYRVLKEKGKIIAAIVDRDSFLGKFYGKKRNIFYSRANFLTVDELRNILGNAGFSTFSYYQTLSKLPSRINSREKPRKGFGEGGFVVILGKKIRTDRDRTV